MKKRTGRMLAMLLSAAIAGMQGMPVQAVEGNFQDSEELMIDSSRGLESGVCMSLGILLRKEQQN